MPIQIGHASLDENKRVSGGKAGDQTGGEVCIRTWYNKGWNKVIRPKDMAVADKMALITEKICNNPNIGYDQSQRTTLYTQAKALNWNIDALTVNCECDCSTLVAVAVNAAGIAVSKDIYTGNQAAALKKTGSFDILTDSKYLIVDDYLKRGDVLLKEGQHTAVVLGNGSRISTNISGYFIGKTYILQNNMYVRLKPNGSKKKFTDMTADAKRNGVSDSEGNGILNKGTAITVLSVEKLDNSIWLKIPSGYVCAVNSSGSVYIK